MAKQTINIGASPNDGTGTPLRTSFDYCNQNFTELYTATGPSGNNIVVPGSATITGAANLNGAVNLNTAGTSTVLLGSSAGYGVLSGSGTNAASIYINGATRPGFNSVLQFGAAEHQWYNSSLSTLIATLNTTGLGVGVVPTAKLNLATSSGSCIAGMTNGTNSVQYAVDSTGPYIYSITPGAQSLRVLAPTGVPVFTIDGTGNVGVANGNVILGTSGKGIDFSATSSGSGTMTSELLNDYEEGTFTPIITGSTTAGVGVYTLQTARYTKVGKVVHFKIRIGWSAHTGTGDLQIDGLPFASENVSNLHTACSIGLFEAVSLSASNVATAFVNNGSTTIAFYQYPVGGGGSAAVPIDVSASIIIAGSYFA